MELICNVSSSVVLFCWILLCQRKAFKKTTDRYSRSVLLLEQWFPKCVCVGGGTPLLGIAKQFKKNIGKVGNTFKMIPAAPVLLSYNKCFTHSERVKTD